MLTDNLSHIEFTDILNVELIQQLQDSFSAATGVASLITKPDGTPITKPSNFCGLCQMIRQTKKGAENCYRSDAVLGRQHLGGPIYQKCLSGGLWDGGASISVGEKHIANWLIGQVLHEASDENEILAYGRDIGVDEEAFKQELKRVKRMSLEQFKKAADALYIFANELSERAYKNFQLKLHQEQLELMVRQKTEDLEVAIEQLRAINEELYDKNDIINHKNEALEDTLHNLRDTQMQLVQAEKMASLGVLTAGVAHELNNPLNYIKGAQEALLQFHKEHSLEKNYEQTSDLLEALKTGVERSSTIIQGLTQFSRSSKSYAEDCKIHAILDNCLSMVYNQMKHNIDLEKHYALEDLQVKGNVGALHQVFINVLSNAIQAIPVQGKIEIETALLENKVRIEIRDSGTGIDIEHLQKVTDPFFTTKDPGKGTGLGLSITYNIIKEHQGELDIQSQAGIGTQVSITLPLERHS